MSDSSENVNEEEIKGSRNDLYHWVFVIGGLFLSVIVNAIFLWPINHLFAFLLMAAFVALVAFYEMRIRGINWKKILFTVIGLFILATLARIVSGPAIDTSKNEAVVPVAAPLDRQSIDREKSIPLEDTQLSGELKPANEPTPPNGCDGHPVADGAVKVLIGDNAFVNSGNGVFSVVAIGVCDAVSLERKPEGLYVNASLYDNEGREVITLKNNIIAALNGEHYVARQSYDKSSITIRSPQGTELFFVRYLNPTTVRVRGFFGCHNVSPVHIADDQPIPGLYMSKSCMFNNRVGIQINPR